MTVIYRINVRSRFNWEADYRVTGIHQKLTAQNEEDIVFRFLYREII